MYAHVLVFRLLVAHVFTDYVLQSEFMADAKHPASTYRREKFGPWWWWAFAHALVNGAGVYWATYSFWCAYFETAVHGLVDYAKCRGRLTTAQDQALHLASKVLWFLWVGGWR